MKQRLLGHAALVFGPGALVGLLGFWCSSLPLRRTLAATHGQREAVAASLPDASTIAAAQERAAALRGRVQAASAGGSVPDTTSQGLVVLTERAAWHGQLTDVLVARGLQVLGEERQDVDLPADLARNLAVHSGSLRCAAWTVRFAGSYPAVVAALEALRGARLPCHVLDLTMKRDARGLLLWTLTVA